MTCRHIRWIASVRAMSSSRSALVTHPSSANCDPHLAPVQNPMCRWPLSRLLRHCLRRSASDAATLLQPLSFDLSLERTDDHVCDAASVLLGEGGQLIQES